MDIDRLVNLLRFAIPDEIYDIEPGQVVYFVPKEGMDKKSSKTLYDLSRLFTEVKQRNVRTSVVSTDNEALIGMIACRNVKEISSPYKVAIGPWETGFGLVSEYYGMDGDSVFGKLCKMGPGIRSSFTYESPVVISIDANGRSGKHSTSIDSDSYDDPGMGMLQKRPETDKERKDLVDKYEQKFRKMLWECAYLGIDLNINGIVEEVELNKTKTEGYGLSLQMEKNKTSSRIDCKVFVGDGLEMKVTAVRKAVYLAFLTLEDGLVIEEATPAFTRRIQKIYRQLPDREEKEEKEGGLLYVDYIQSKTLRGYMSDINSAIAKLVPNGLIAIELSIEGLKEGAFKVIRSTPEIREQIIKAFNL